MEWIIAALAIVVIGFAAIASTGRLGELPDAPADTFRPKLPKGALTSDDVRDVQFGVALRGYDMSQVDALLERIADQMDGKLPEVDEEDDDEIVDDAVEPAPMIDNVDSDPRDSDVWNNELNTDEQK